MGLAGSPEGRSAARPSLSGSRGGKSFNQYG